MLGDPDEQPKPTGIAFKMDLDDGSYEDPDGSEDDDDDDFLFESLSATVPGEIKMQFDVNPMGGA